ncbi:hypothetical protein JCM16408A_53260 [Methylobacterium phyllosphaerae]
MAREDESCVLPIVRLRGSRREAAAVARLLRDRGRTVGTLLVGTRAAHKAIINALPARFVDLAMHGDAVPRGARGSTPREDTFVDHQAPDWRAGLGWSVLERRRGSRALGRCRATTTGFCSYGTSRCCGSPARNSWSVRPASP